MIDLFSDPRPDLSVDSSRWVILFGLIPKNFENELGMKLLKRLHAYRSLGTTIQQTREGLKLIPHPEGAWENQQEFDDDAKQFLVPYAKEIKFLLRKVQEHG